METQKLAQRDNAEDLLTRIASSYFNGYQISISSTFYTVYYCFHHKQENLPFDMWAQQRT